MVPHYTFHDRFAVRIEREESAAESLLEVLGLTACDPVTSPNLTIRIRRGSPREPLSRTLGEGYGRSGDRFMLKNSPGRLSIDREWNEFVATRSFSRHYLRRLVEGEIRLRLAEDDIVFVHASSVELNGRTLLFPAWQNTGKTTLLLSLLVEGADFLSDDRLGVASDGTAYGYETAPHVEPHMMQFLADKRSLRYLRYKIGEYVDDHLGWDDGLPRRGLKYLNRELVREEFRVPIPELVPDSTFVRTGETTALVFLSTYEDGVTTPTLRDMDPETAVTLLEAIRYQEWDDMLYRVYSAFDALFPDSDSKRERLERLQRVESEVFERLVERVPIYELQLPTRMSWSESERRALVDSLSTIG